MRFTQLFLYILAASVTFSAKAQVFFELEDIRRKEYHQTPYDRPRWTLETASDDIKRRSLAQLRGAILRETERSLREVPHFAAYALDLVANYVMYGAKLSNEIISANLRYNAVGQIIKMSPQKFSSAALPLEGFDVQVLVGSRRAQRAFDVKPEELRLEGKGNSLKPRFGPELQSEITHAVEGQPYDVQLTLYSAGLKYHLQLKSEDFGDCGGELAGAAL